MSHPPLNATWDNLGRPEPRGALWRWKECLESNDVHQGLWIVAPRGVGSSYAANVAMRGMVREHNWSWEWVKAGDLITAQRNRWSAEDAVRHHSDDYALWQESMVIQEEFNFLWKEADIICIDDLHSSLDIGFWRKHLQHDLESRVKDGRPVVVATDMAPTHVGFADITRVIENLFVVCDARR